MFGPATWREDKASVCKALFLLQNPKQCVYGTCLVHEGDAIDLASRRTWEQTGRDGGSAVEPVL